MAIQKEVSWRPANGTRRFGRVLGYTHDRKLARIQSGPRVVVVLSSELTFETG